MNAHNAIKQMQRFLGEQILSPVSPLRGEEPGERGLVAATPDASPQLPLRSEEGEQLARESQFKPRDQP